MSELESNAALPRALAIIAMLAAPVHGASAQMTGQVVVRVTANSTPLPGASIATGTAATATDRAGLAIFNLPMGRRVFLVKSAGFAPESLAVTIAAGTNEVSVAMRRQNSPGAIVASRRDTRRETDEPTSVDVAGRDALDAQIDRSPGAIDGLIARMDGVRTQPLLAGSGGEGIRIHGMPARYTKILSDGLPLFGATPEGLEPLQTSALGLDRVEVVKGVSSSLYGPTALGGVVNMVSASPGSSSEVVVNGSSREGSDVAAFQTYTFSPKWSGTLLASRDYQNASDPDGDGWAEVAGYKRIVVQPRAYWARNDNGNWFFTGGWMSENRRSGTFDGARLADFNMFSDDADTRRANAGTVGRILLDTNTVLVVRGSMTREWRTRWYGDNRERDRRNTIFTDVAVTRTLGPNRLTGGMGLERDQFNALDTREWSYRYTTPALYAEDTWTPDRRLGITTGARLDLHSEFGDFVSPRAAIVVHPSDTWTARLSASAGAYAPTPLTDETLGSGLDHVRPTPREAEHATGWVLDVDNVRGELELSGTAYRTVINHPLILRTRGEELELVNAGESAHTEGIDLSARYHVERMRFTTTYSYVDAARPEIGEIVGEDFAFDTTMHRALPLTPRHTARFDATYERPNDRILGLEVALVGPQTLSDTLATTTSAYVTIDARFEKHIRSAILFVHGENLTGTHQRQFLPVVLSASSPSGQWSGDAWAPLGGPALNVGLRLRY